MIPLVWGPGPLTFMWEALRIPSVCSAALRPSMLRAKVHVKASTGAWGPEFSYSYARELEDSSVRWSSVFLLFPITGTN